MKKRKALIKTLALTTAVGMTMGMLGFTGASAYMTPSSFDKQTIEYYTNLGSGVKSSNVPWNVVTRTLESDGTLTEKATYNYIRDDDSNYPSIALTGASVTVNNIIAEDNDSCDPVLYSKGPVTVNITGGQWNYGNKQGVSKYTNYDVSHGRVMFTRLSSEDGNTLYNETIYNELLAAGEGYESVNKTVTLTEPGVYSAGIITASCNIGFGQSTGLSVCILGDGDDMTLDPSTVTAYPKYTSMTINNKQYKCPAYTINNETYVKIRTLGYMLNNTSKQFNVNCLYWPQSGIDNLNIRVNGHPAYEAVGGELASLANGAVTAKKESQHIIYDDFHIQQYIYPSAYAINGSCYMNLKDMAKIMDFAISQDGNTGMVYVDTSKAYYETSFK